jgi:NitT/TauT family transport system substrate-binding protein
MTLQRGTFLKLAGATAAAPVLGPLRSASAADLPLVHTLSVPTDGTKALLYARKVNLFAKHGLSVDVGSMGSGATIYAAVLGGAAQFGSGNLFSVFSAFARGVPLRIVAPATMYVSENSDTFLIVAKDGPIRSARDLNGKTIGVGSVRDSDDYATRGWMALNGGDGQSLHAVELPPAQQTAALDAGRVDASVVRPPFLTVAMASGKYRQLGKPFDSIGQRFLLSCWVSTADYIAKNPAIVGDFAAVLSEAGRYVNAHEAETVDLVAGFTGQDPALIARGVRSTMADNLTLADVQRPLDFAVKNGLVERAFDVTGLLAPSVQLSR